LVRMRLRAAKHFAQVVPTCGSCSAPDCAGAHVGQCEHIRFPPGNNYDANADWARADHDRRKIFNFLGLYDLPKGLTSSVVFNAWSGLPYNITTGFDNNGDTVANDRPPGI